MFRPLILICAILALWGCKTSEERAEEYYQSGLILLKTGDSTAAVAEFRNALQRDDLHKGARVAIASVLLKNGQPDAAYSQYVSLQERYPDDIEIRLAMAEMALSAENFTEAERQGTEARRLAPADPRVKAVKAAIDYNNATLADDGTALAASVTAAQAALADAPDSLAARRVVIHSLLNGGDPAKALPDIEIAIDQTPDSLEFAMLKLTVLSQAAGDTERGAQLKAMYEKFPDNPDVRRWLYDWYVAKGDNAQTLTFLRDLAARSGSDPEPQLRLVQFINGTQGPDAAEAEYSRLADHASDPALSDYFHSLGAEIGFDQGRRAQAVSLLREVIAKAAPSSQTNDIKVKLAIMLGETGEVSGAAALVDAVISDDTTHIEATKLRATWFLKANKPRDALDLLRAAIDLHPRDPELLIMAAKAYERDGATALAGRNLALAVEVSGTGEQESLQFYEFLIRTGSADAANSILTTALQTHPDSVPLLVVAIESRSVALDWRAANRLITQLSSIKSDKARAVATTAEATLQRRKAISAKALDTLQQIADAGKPAIVAPVRRLRTAIEGGRLDDARAYLDDRLAEAPDDQDLRLVNACLTTLEHEIGASR